MVPIAIETGIAYQLDVTVQRRLDTDYRVIDDPGDTSIRDVQSDSGAIVSDNSITTSPYGRVRNLQYR